MNSIGKQLEKLGKVRGLVSVAMLISFLVGMIVASAIGLATTGGISEVDYVQIQGEIFAISGKADITSQDWVPTTSGTWRLNITVTWKAGLPVGTYTLEPVINGITFSPTSRSETFSGLLVADQVETYSFDTTLTTLPSNYVKTTTIEG